MNPPDLARLRALAGRSRSGSAFLTRASRTLAWALLVAAAMWIYLPLLRAELVWEAPALVQASTGVPVRSRDAREPYRDVLDYTREVGGGPEHFRPLVALSFRLDQARDNRGISFHTTSLVFHLLNCVLLYFLARGMRLSSGAAWFAALVFAVYPLCTRSVGHIAGREELLGFTFLAAALLFHLSGSWLRQPVAVLFYALALLALPAAGGVMALFLVAESRGRRPWLVAVLRMLPYLVVTVAMLLVVRQHFGTLGFLSGREGNPRLMLSTLPVAFCDLFQQLLRPHDLSQPSVLSFRGSNLVPWVTSLHEPRFLVGLAFSIGYAVTVWLTDRGRGRALLPLVMIPALWLPLDSLWFGRAFDRTLHLYAPSAGFALLVASVVARAGFEGRTGVWRRGLVGGAAAVVTLTFLVASQVRALVWRDEGNVYLEALARYPSVAGFRAAYGTWLARHGEQLRAVDELRRASTMEPNLPDVRFNLGLALSTLSRDGEAAEQFAQAGFLAPGDPEAWYFASRSELRKHQLEDALQDATRALNLAPGRARYLVRLGEVWLARRNYNDAEDAARRAIAADGRSADAYRLLAGALRSQGRLEEAISASGHAIALDPHSPESVLERVRDFAAARRNAEALDELDRYFALEAHPDSLAVRLQRELR